MDPAGTGLKTSANESDVSVLLAQIVQYQDARDDESHRKLMDIGDALAQMGAYGLALDRCFIPATRLTDHENAVPYMARTNIGIALCEFELSISEDPSLTQDSTLACALSSLDRVRQAMTTISTDEEAYWIVYNGTVVSYRIIRVLSDLGFTADVVEFALWITLSMESNLPLMTVKYLGWRCRLYATTANLYSALQHYDMALKIIKRAISQVDTLESLHASDPSPPLEETTQGISRAKTFLAPYLYKFECLSSGSAPSLRQRFPKDSEMFAAAAMTIEHCGRRIVADLAVPHPAKNVSDTICKEIGPVIDTYSDAFLRRLSDSVPTRPPSASPSSVSTGIAVPPVSGKPTQASTKASGKKTPPASAKGGKRAAGKKDAKPPPSPSPVPSSTQVPDEPMPLAEANEGLPLHVHIELVKQLFTSQQWEQVQGLGRVAVTRLAHKNCTVPRPQRGAYERQIRLLLVVAEHFVNPSCETAASVARELLQCCVESSSAESGVLSRPPAGALQKRPVSAAPTAESIRPDDDGGESVSAVTSAEEIDLLPPEISLSRDEARVCRTLLMKEFRSTIEECGLMLWSFIGALLHHVEVQNRFSPSASFAVQQIVAAHTSSAIHEYFKAKHLPRSGAPVPPFPETVTDEHIRVLGYSLTAIHQTLGFVNCTDAALRSVVALRLAHVLEDDVVNDLATASMAVADAIDNLEDTRAHILKFAGPEVTSMAISTSFELGDEKLPEKKHELLHRLISLHTDCVMTWFRVELKRGLHDARATSVRRHEMTLSRVYQRQEQQAIYGMKTHRDAARENSLLTSLPECPEFSQRNERELLALSNKNPYYRAILHLNRAELRSSVATDRAACLKEAVRCVTQAYAIEDKIMAFLKDEPVEPSRRPPAPKIVSRTCASVTLRAAAFVPKCGTAVASYCVFGKPAGSGTAVSLNCSEYPGTNTPFSPDTEITVSGLERNESYVFAVSAYDANGHIIGGGIGKTTPDLVALFPLSLFQLRAYVVLAAEKLECDTIAREVGGQLYKEFVDSYPIEPLWKTSPLEWERIHRARVSATPRVVLVGVVGSILAYADCVIRQQFMDDDDAFLNPLAEPGHELRGGLKPQVQTTVSRLRLTRRLLVALEIALELGDDSLAAAAITRTYSTLLPVVKTRSDLQWTPYAIDVFVFLQRAVRRLSSTEIALQRHLDAIAAAVTWSLIKHYRARGEDGVVKKLIGDGAGLTEISINPALEAENRPASSMSNAASTRAEAPQPAAVERMSEQAALAESVLVLCQTQVGSASASEALLGADLSEVYKLLSSSTPSAAIAELKKKTPSATSLLAILRVVQVATTNVVRSALPFSMVGVVAPPPSVDQSPSAASLPQAAKGKAPPKSAGGGGGGGDKGGGSVTSILNELEMVSSWISDALHAVDTHVTFTTPFPTIPPLEEVPPPPEGEDPPSDKESEYDWPPKDPATDAQAAQGQAASGDADGSSTPPPPPVKTVPPALLGLKGSERKNRRAYAAGVLTLLLPYYFARRKYLKEKRLMSSECRGWRACLELCRGALRHTWLEIQAKRGEFPLNRPDEPEKDGNVSIAVQQQKSKDNLKSGSSANVAAVGKPGKAPSSAGAGGGQPAPEADTDHVTILADVQRDCLRIFVRAQVNAVRAGMWTVAETAVRRLHASVVGWTPNLSNHHQLVSPVLATSLSYLVDMFSNVKRSKSLNPDTQLLHPPGSRLAGAETPRTDSPRSEMDTFVKNERWYLQVEDVDIAFYKNFILNNLEVMTNAGSHHAISRVGSELLAFADTQLAGRLLTTVITSCQCVGLDSSSFDVQLSHWERDRPVALEHVFHCRQLLADFLSEGPEDGAFGQATGRGAGRSSRMSDVGSEMDLSVYSGDGGMTTGRKSIHTGRVGKKKRYKNAAEARHEKMVSQVISAYEETSKILRQKNEMGLLVQILHELGNFHAYLRNFERASEAWSDAVDAVFGVVHVASTYQTVLHGLTPGQTVSEYGLWGMLEATVLLYKLAKYVHVADVGRRLDACVFASKLVHAAFGGDATHPYRIWDFVDYRLKELWRGVDLFEDLHRLEPTVLLEALEFISRELILNDMSLLALPALVLHTHVATDSCHDVFLSCVGRILRCEALTKVGAMSEAVRALLELGRGDDLPGSVVLPSVVSVQRSDVPKFFNHLPPEHPENRDALSLLASTELEDHVLLRLGNFQAKFVTARWRLAKASFFMALGMIPRVVSHQILAEQARLLLPEIPPEASEPVAPAAPGSPKPHRTGYLDVMKTEPPAEDALLGAGTEDEVGSETYCLFKATAILESLRTEFAPKDAETSAKPESRGSERNIPDKSSNAAGKKDAKRTRTTSNLGVPGSSTNLTAAGAAAPEEIEVPTPFQLLMYLETASRIAEIEVVARGNVSFGVGVLRRAMAITSSHSTAQAINPFGAVNRSTSKLQAVGEEDGSENASQSGVAEDVSAILPGGSADGTTTDVRELVSVPLWMRCRVFLLRCFVRGSRTDLTIKECEMTAREAAAVNERVWVQHTSLARAYVAEQAGDVAAAIHAVDDVLPTCLSLNAALPNPVLAEVLFSRACMLLSMPDFGGRASDALRDLEVSEETYRNLLFAHGLQTGLSVLTSAAAHTRNLYAPGIASLVRVLVLRARVLADQKLTWKKDEAAAKKGESEKRRRPGGGGANEMEELKGQIKTLTEREAAAMGAERVKEAMELLRCCLRPVPQLCATTFFTLGRCLRQLLLTPPPKPPVQLSPKKAKMLARRGETALPVYDETVLEWGGPVLPIGIAEAEVDTTEKVEKSRSRQNSQSPSKDKSNEKEKEGKSTMPLTDPPSAADDTNLGTTGEEGDDAERPISATSDVDSTSEEMVEKAKNFVYAASSLHKAVIWSKDYGDHDHSLIRSALIELVLLYGATLFPRYRSNHISTAVLYLKAACEVSAMIPRVSDGGSKWTPSELPQDIPKFLTTDIKESHANFAARVEKKTDGSSLSSLTVREVAYYFATLRAEQWRGDFLDEQYIKLVRVHRLLRDSCPEYRDTCLMAGLPNAGEAANLSLGSTMIQWYLVGRDRVMTPSVITPFVRRPQSGSRLRMLRDAQQDNKDRERLQEKLKQSSKQDGATEGGKDTFVTGLLLLSQPSFQQADRPNLIALQLPLKKVLQLEKTVRLVTLKKANGALPEDEAELKELLEACTGGVLTSLRDGRLDDEFRQTREDEILGLSSGEAESPALMGRGVSQTESSPSMAGSARGDPARLGSPAASSIGTSERGPSREGRERSFVLGEEPSIESARGSVAGGGELSAPPTGRSRASVAPTAGDGPAGVSRPPSTVVSQATTASVEQTPVYKPPTLSVSNLSDLQKLFSLETGLEAISPFLADNIDYYLYPEKERPVISEESYANLAEKEKEKDDKKGKADAKRPASRTKKK